MNSTALGTIEKKSVDPFFSGRRHRPELDGLRGLAIILVMASHYAWYLPVHGNWFIPIGDVISKGWTGVDLFFVLSGFLITGVLLDSKGQKNYFRNFYARRILRIFPLYYGFLSCLLVIMVFLKFDSPEGSQLYSVAQRQLHEQPWLWTFTANLYTVFTGRWLTIVAHLWSLSVEEQFYLIWPLAILLVRCQRFSRLCVAVIIGSLLLRIALTADGFSWARIYVLMPCRADAFAMGAFVAVILRTSPEKLRNGGLMAIWICGLALLAAIMPTILVEMPWRPGSTAAAPEYLAGLWRGVRLDGMYSIISGFFAGVVGVLSVPGRMMGVRQLLSSWPMRRFGRYSYALYIYHYTLLSLSAYYFPATRFPLGEARPWVSVEFLVLNIGLSFTLAVASYHCFEKYFLKLKRYFPEETRMPTRASA